MICKLCRVKVNQAQTVQGYCKSCSTFTQTLDAFETYILDESTLEILHEYLLVRAEILKMKIKFLSEQK